ncbi:MAG: VOC family protein [Candidatus Eremiobacteraeota bacterium]|nr:VOC family protein [Candidatus Eremiobacteraeota bacterium]
MATATSIKITGIDIHCYLVKDPQRAIAFYRETLGLTPSWEEEQGAEFELADGTTFGVWKMSDGSWHPSAGVFFAVPDLKEAIAQLRARGVKFEHPEPFESNVCHMIGAEDSEGNTFMLHQRKQES